MDGGSGKLRGLKWQWKNWAEGPMPCPRINAHFNLVKMARVMSSIPHEGREERDFFHLKARELGYDSFVDFCKAAMFKYIEDVNPILASFQNVAELADKNLKFLEVSEQNNGLDPSQEQARVISKLIYNLVANSQLVMDSPSLNQSFKKHLTKNFDINTVLNIYIHGNR